MVNYWIEKEKRIIFTAFHRVNTTDNILQLFSSIQNDPDYSPDLHSVGIVTTIDAIPLDCLDNIKEISKGFKLHSRKRINSKYAIVAPLDIQDALFARVKNVKPLPDRVAVFNEIQTALEWVGAITGSIQQKRILILDDDSSILQMLTYLFSMENKYEIKTVSDVFNAGVVIEQFNPDVLIVDIHLKETDGREICRLIKENPLYNHVKIIGMSGDSMLDEKREIIASGFDAFIRKPFDLKQMIGTIAAMLN